MAAAAASEGLSHHALFYRDQREYQMLVTSFVRAGLAGAEPVFIAVPGARDHLLRAPLNGAPGQLAYADMTETGRNPARIIPELRAFVDRHQGKPCRIVTEPAWRGRSDAELCETARHEALINLAFAGTPVRILCPYPADVLAGPVIEWAHCTHPSVISGGVSGPSASYAGAGRLPPACDNPLPPPPPSAEALSYRTDLWPIRRLVASCADRSGLAGDRADNLVLAASEIAANTLRHTEGGGTLHVWQTRHELLCQLHDQGWITDPLAGRRRRSAIETGHGLWLVNQVCDLVELRTGRAGTTVRLHMNLAGVSGTQPANSRRNGHCGRLVRCDGAVYASSSEGSLRMLLILAILLIAIILGGLGFAIHVLWWVALAVLVIWLLGFLFRTAEGVGTRRRRWYRW
ncbi:MAG TPA: sensor histidine kinase [Streptosporangiaceae bacterium]|nr:sensor histidine kinase [Streptosporangiaceae bacterium]